MPVHEGVASQLAGDRKTWVVTGVAGFIGSNLLEELLRLDQTVVGIDNFSTGRAGNLEEVRASVDQAQWQRFTFIEGDIAEPATCRDACAGTDYVLHQAALGSVPRSIADPQASTAANVTGFLNMLVAARDAGAGRVVYASSSAVYGDHPDLPKREANIGEPLSPYAATKRTDELFATSFARCYDMSVIGLRYFNVFGRRQDPDGAYAAVIPRWIAGMIANEPIYINGDGTTSRDFCYIDNVVRANLLAALGTVPHATHEVFNIAAGGRTTLDDLFRLIRDELARHRPACSGIEPVYRDFRPGDVAHSHADISKAARLLGYRPTHDVGEGIGLAVESYLERAASEMVTS